MGTAKLAKATPAIEPGIFIDKSTRPTDAAVEDAIGSGFPLWVALRAALAEAFDPVDEDWTFSGKRYGWSLRLRQRDRPIAYLTPLADRFRASLALPERALDAGLPAALPLAVRTTVAAAPTYPEGRAVRLLVTSDEDVASILALARVRMAG